MLVVSIIWNKYIYTLEIKDKFKIQKDNLVDISINCSNTKR